VDHQEEAAAVVLPEEDNGKENKVAGYWLLVTGYITSNKQLATGNQQLATSN
jgi:hypothetical protein